MKKGKTKTEQIFQLMIGAVMCLIVLCVSGCGGRSCECVQVGCEDDAQGISVPGLGGCLSSGKGCNSCLWAQSCKWVCVEDTEEYKDLNVETGEYETKEKNIYTFTACDVRYYDGSCLGCGSCSGCGKTKLGQKSCVSGCSWGEDPTYLFYENNDKGCVLGCDSDGCVRCTTQGEVSDFAYIGERKAGID